MDIVSAELGKCYSLICSSLISRSGSVEPQLIFVYVHAAIGYEQITGSG
jgi:hypothetical protein